METQFDRGKTYTRTSPSKNPLPIPGSGGVWGSPTYRVIASQWDGSVNYGADVSGWDNNRNSYWNSYYPGNTFTRNTNTLYTYSGAVNLGFVALSAQSGASIDTQLVWHNSGSSTLYLYGNDNYPLYSTIIYASQY